jgi:DNA-binding response OmpR family regulator
MSERFQILVVEDAEADVFLVREALQQAGLEFELLVLSDGEKAVNFIDNVDLGGSTNGPHLVLLDLNLPKKSGGQVLERVRRSRVCGQVPVVILTSSESPKDKMQAAKLRATEYFRKPSKLDEFMKLGPLVQRILNPQPAH